MLYQNTIGFLDFMKEIYMAEDKSLSGLSNDEARAFHGLFMFSFAGFTVIALVAHTLVWNWRPWFAG